MKILQWFIKKRNYSRMPLMLNGGGKNAGGN